MGTPLSRHRLTAPAGALAASLLAAGALARGGAPAFAAAQPTVRSAQRKLTQLTSLEDQAVQAYDQSAQQLADARGRLSVVDHEAGADHARLLRMRLVIAQIAASAYEDSGQTSVAALLTDPRAQAALSQAAILQHLSSVQDAEMTTALTAARQYAAAQQAARRIQTAVLALERQRMARRNTITAAVARQKSLLARLTAQQQQAAQTGGGTTAGAYSGPTGTQADTAVAFAYAQLGKPYVWGATGPSSYDCSGLVEAAWAQAGVAIPRTTYEQWSALPHIPMSEIQPGDLVFFDSIGHVAIYVGGGMIIDAPQPGEYVEKVSLSSPWYSTNLDGAARP